MAEQIINNGSSAGDPTAENIYTSFEKTKDNFSELYAFIPTLLAKAGGIMTGVLQFATGTAAAPSAKVGTDQKGFYEVGSNTLGVTIAGSKVGEFNVNGYSGLTNRLIMQDRRPVNTGGGAGVAGSWNQRTINTVLVNNITGASMGTNQFTLPVGRYKINNIQATCYAVDYNKLRLYNISNSTTQTDVNSNAIIGSTSYFYSVSFVGGKAEISGYYFDVTTSPKTFKIEHYISVSSGGNDFGIATNTATDEIYLTIDIEKVG